MLKLKSKEIFVLDASVEEVHICDDNIFVVTKGAVFKSSLKSTSRGSALEEDVFKSLLNESTESNHRHYQPINLGRSSLWLEKQIICTAVVFESKFLTCEEDNLLWTFQIFNSLEKDPKYLSEIAIPKGRKNVADIASYTDESSILELYKDVFNKPEKPVFLLVSSPSHTYSSNIIRGSHFKMQQDLYSALFGPDAGLLGSSVILIGLPDGRVISWVMTDGERVRQEEMNINLVCDLEQPVVGIFLTSLVNNDAPKPGDCLLIVGKHGKVVLVHVYGSGSESFSFIHIPSPVSSKALQIKGNIILHAADKQVWISELKTTDCVEVTTCKTSISGVHVLKLTELNAQSAIVWCLLEHGSLVLMKWSDLLVSRKSQSSEVGLSFEKALHSIHECSQNMQDVQLKLKWQEQLLTQLGIAAALLFSGSKNETFPSCTCTVEMSSIYSDVYVLQVQFDNIEALGLKKDWWYFVVNVQEKYSSSGKSLVKSIPCRNGIETVQLSLRIHPSEVSSFHLPLLVSCGLQFGNKELKSQFSYVLLLNKFLPLYVKVCVLTVDHLHVIQPYSKPHNSSLTCPPLALHTEQPTVKSKNISPHQILLDIAKTKPSFHLLYKQPITGHLEVDSHQTVVPIFVSSVKQILKKKFGKIEATLFQTVMPGLLKLFTGDKYIHTSQDAVCLQGVCFGQEVKLSFTQVEEVIEVKIVAQSYPEMVAFRCAVLHRLKNLIPTDHVVDQDVMIKKEYLAQIKGLMREAVVLDPTQSALAVKELELYERFRRTFTSNLPLL
ncbi:Fanconi anemia core complex-associated protein 100-like isoform X5 [Tachypleus tridentatus]|uniref:Fanconi anemia core complex-associated protein 100-like isoform X5 n=1 Tax=Tachypleus tridentatus TaxID=6853 RepID=UPI003FD2E01D